MTHGAIAREDVRTPRGTCGRGVEIRAAGRNELVDDGICRGKICRERGQALVNVRHLGGLEAIHERLVAQQKSGRLPFGTSGQHHLRTLG